MRSAVVVGAQGVIGRYIVEKLASLPDWEITGLSRRRGVEGPRVRHIAVDLLLRYVSPAWHHRLALMAQGCVLVFLGLVFWASLPVIELTSETRATATDIPMSWVYIAAPVGCVLIAIETLRLVARTWAEMRQGGAA